VRPFEARIFARHVLGVKPPDTVGGTGGATLNIDSTTFGQSTGVAIGTRQEQFRLGVNF